MKKVAVILSGCGVYDGSEIHEAVLCMLAIEQNGGSYSLFAPDKEQAHVMNHLKGEVMDEKRNVLVEAARIARGNIKPLAELDEADFDALLLPGGYGAAKNLSSFGFEGKNMTVDSNVEFVLHSFFKSNKPIGAVCIAPVILAKTFGKVSLTIGDEVETVSAIQSFGSNHIQSNNKNVVVDIENKLVTGPCYMLDATISEIAFNTNEVVKALFELVD